MIDQNVPNPMAKNPDFNTHKVFAAIGIILIVMVIICGGIWYLVQSAEDKAGPSDDNTTIKTATSSAKKSTTSANKDETADWKTYSSKVLSLSIKYPSDWVYVETPYDQGVTFETSNFKLYGGSVTSGQFVSINIQKNQTSKSIDNWWSNEGAGDYFVSEKKSIKVDGHNAIEYKVMSSGSYYGALIDNSNTVYVIDIGSTVDLKLDTLKIFDKMLPTFKFL